jgi:hypothetical protein
MQFNPFEILYFPTFIFKNGAQPKAKFFITIMNIKNEVIVVSLPTSQDFIPDALLVEGCIEHPTRFISSYCFFPEIKICSDSDFAFALNTFIYADQVDAYDASILERQYPVENVDYYRKGTLLEDKQSDLLDCLINSKQLRRGIKKKFR